MQFKLTMSALLLSILGLSVGISRCPMWKEIVPCTCKKDSTQYTTVSCEKMNSFDQVANILRGHFTPSDRVSLKLAYSNLNDLNYRMFKELNMTIDNLKLNHDIIGPLNEDTFDGLSTILYLSLADNSLESVPEHIWKKVPNVKTVDLGRAKIKYISDSSFRVLQQLEALVLPGNQISRMDSKSIPSHIRRLHLGRNHIKDLNRTLTNLSELVWLFLNSNELSTLDDQLPTNAPNLKMLHASHNKIDKLPQQLKSFPLLESLFLQNNKITQLGGALAKSRKLQRVVLEHNNIETITEEDFAETEVLESLILGHNQITTLNNSLLNLRNLNFLNITYNELKEFSFQDVIGLQELRSMDLSYNKITSLIGPAALFQNLVEWNIKLTELKLDHNLLETLNGALSGLPELLRLNLSFNRLRKISPDDLIGLDQLRLLDLSHNHLTTLEETSKTFLPKLSELRASHNYLTILEKDFHGLPVLCHADLSSNQIVALGRDLVTKTRCKIEHGVHEGTWDTLKIYLQDNPILCDAALPEIMSAMEINHTRISGVSHCPPLSEQPTTTKPNAFLGYIPETTPSVPIILPASYSNSGQNLYKPTFDTKSSHLTDSSQLQPNNNLVFQENNGKPPVELRHIEHYTVSREAVLQKPISGTTSDINLKTLNTDGVATSTSDIKGVETQETSQAIVIDPVKQEQQITKLASEIEELRSRIDQLSNQNQLLLNQQFNKSVPQLVPTNNFTSKPPNENIEESRKP